jgi:hypothetical protein
MPNITPSEVEQESMAPHPGGRPSPTCSPRLLGPVPLNSVTAGEWRNGRRASLRSWYRKRCAGSTPASPTTTDYVRGRGSRLKPCSVHRSVDRPTIEPDQSRNVSQAGCVPMPWTKTMPMRFGSSCWAIAISYALGRAATPVYRRADNVLRCELRPLAAAGRHDRGWLVDIPRSTDRPRSAAPPIICRQCRPQPRPSPSHASS